MTVESPCVRICKLSANNVCIGCGRTVEEIAKWTVLTDHEKQAVLDRINARLAQR